MYAGGRGYLNAQRCVQGGGRGSKFTDFIAYVLYDDPLFQYIISRHFVFKLIRQAKLFRISCINEELGTQKPFFLTTIFRSINRSLSSKFELCCLNLYRVVLFESLVSHFQYILDTTIKYTKSWLLIQGLMVAK